MTESNEDALVDTLALHPPLLGTVVILASASCLLRATRHRPMHACSSATATARARGCPRPSARRGLGSTCCTILARLKSSLWQLMQASFASAQGKRAACHPTDMHAFGWA